MELITNYDDVPTKVGETSPRTRKTANRTDNLHGDLSIHLVLHFGRSGDTFFHWQSSRQSQLFLGQQMLCGLGVGFEFRRGLLPVREAIQKCCFLEVGKSHELKWQRSATCVTCHGVIGDAIRQVGVFAVPLASELPAVRFRKEQVLRLNWFWKGRQGTTWIRCSVYFHTSHFRASCFNKCRIQDFIKEKSNVRGSLQNMADLINSYRNVLSLTKGAPDGKNWLLFRGSRERPWLHDPSLWIHHWLQFI